MTTKKGVSKREVVPKSRRIIQDTRQRIKQQPQQPVVVRGPIPLPIDALREVISFIPRAQRTALALGSRQMASVIVPGVSAEREKVGSSTSNALLP